MRLQYAALKRETYPVVNIADVEEKGTTVPLEDRTIDSGRAAGFEYIGRERFPSRIPGQGEKTERFEPILIFRRL